MKSIALLILSFLLFLASCSSPQTSPATPVEMTQIRLPMGYIPSTQYAPLYVAANKGFFTDEGLEVEFDYSYETDGITLVGAGELQFTLGSGEQVILARANEIPIVYVLQWWQKYPIAVMAKTQAGIDSPADMAGRKIGIPGLFGASYVGFEGLLNAVGMNDSDLELVEIGFTQSEALTQDQVEAVVVYANNEPVRFAQQGENIDVIDVSDYVDMVGNGLMTNEQTIKENPELVTSMVRAMLRGLQFTLDDPDAAFEICKEYIEGMDATAEGKAAERAILDASIAMWQAPRPGISSAQAWDTTQQVLLTIDFIQEPIDLNQAWTNEFVEQINLD
ncbi:MAG: ABC transporter substrate-binding protein [Anaerolineales bacterium]|nr:ABC transporter substrate-binding protein [Anaerolineales bacterium]